MPKSIEVKEFDEWQEFRDFVEENFTYDKRYVFRGQRDAEWALETTLDRLIKQLPKELQDENVLRNHLERFKKAIRGRRGPNPKSLTDDEFWALGQHYGLATPLLDWSLAPFIATFFAFNVNRTSGSGKRCMWALNTHAVDEVNNVISTEYNACKHEIKEKYFEKSRVPIVELVKPSLEDNPRIINQAGLFTRGPIRMSLEKWVENYLLDYKQVALYKVILPNTEREAVLAALDQMNINSASLFPDVSGACLYCNETLTLRGEMFTTMKSAVS